MPDLAAAYHDARMTMMDLARGLEEETTCVPACPGWTVRDLIAHVTSIASELSAGNIPADLQLVNLDDAMAQRREDFIDSALETRKTMSIDDLLKEWDQSGALVESMLRGEEPLPQNAPPLMDWVIVTDIGVHMNDLRGALGLPGEGDPLAVGLGLRSYVEAMRAVSAARGLPALKIRAGGREWVVGQGDPIATLSGTPFELNRAASGRRSPDQIRAYDWNGDPEPFIDLFYPYGLREDALVE